MESNRLHIRRFSAQYLIPGNHPAPQSVKTRLDDAIAAPVLSEAISLVLSSLFSATDESVWLIRRIDLSVDVNAAWERDQLTRVIVTRLAREVGASLHNEENGGNIIRFANRAAYVARFISDLSRGAAWGRWYYESFAGLRLLPTSAALRSAICDQTQTGLEALLLLSDHELKEIVRALTNQDVRRILDRIPDAQATAGEFECCQLAWTAWEFLKADFRSSGEGHLALQLFLKAGRDREDVSGPALKAASIAFVVLTRLLSELAVAEQQQLHSALMNSDLAALHQVAGGSAEKLMPFLSCPPEWISKVVATLLAGDTKQTTTSETRRDTSFGGIFLLLPLLDELPLSAATNNWQHSDEAAAITLVRFLLLIKCCGQQHAERAFYDQLLRDLMLIPPRITPSVIRDWSMSISSSQVEVFLETLTSWQETREVFEKKQQILANRLADDLAFLALPESVNLPPPLDHALSVAAQHVLRAFAWRLPGFAESSLPYVSANFLNFSAGLEEEASRRVVHIGSPPLYLVLSLTGMSRQTYRLSGLDQRPLSLFPEN